MNSNHIHNDLIEKIRVGRKNWIDIAEDLYKLKIDENYKVAVGDGIDTWISYISQPEIGLSKNEADKLVKIYDKLVIDGGYDKEELSNIPLKTLYLMLELDITEDLIDKATSLSHRDFREALHEDKQEAAEQTFSYMVMRKSNETGNMNKVKNISSELIKETFNLND